LKVLFIGGTGVISSACSQLAVERGIDLYLLNRGQTKRPVPAADHVLDGDIRDKGSVNRVLDKMTFDVVVDWIAFTPAHIETDFELFRRRTNQFVFISSASAYQKPPASLPITESTPLRTHTGNIRRIKSPASSFLGASSNATAFPQQSSDRRTPTTAPRCLLTAGTPY
jgi:UDP-glucose 4-epimerase